MCRTVSNVKSDLWSKFRNVPIEAHRRFWFRHGSLCAIGQLYESSLMFLGLSGRRMFTDTIVAFTVFEAAVCDRRTTETSSGDSIHGINVYNHADSVSPLRI